MLVLLATLLGTGDIAQGVPPTPPPAPVIPIPTGTATRWNYRLYTDWMLARRGLPVWRTATRLDDSERWETAVIGQRGARFWEIFAEGEFHRTVATVGSDRAGSGGIGEGFEWSVFVGADWTADVDFEFTPNGPRIVLALTYYPYEGIAHRYSWNVLPAQFVHGTSWHFAADELRGMYHWPHLIVWAWWHNLLEAFRSPREE